MDELEILKIAHETDPSFTARTYYADIIKFAKAIAAAQRKACEERLRDAENLLRIVASTRTATPDLQTAARNYFRRSNRYYALEVDMQIEERGPWNARQQSDDHIKGVFVESDDFTHDVRLYVNGDFASGEQKLAYAKEIAKRLNAWEVHNAELTGDGRLYRPASSD